MTLQLFEGQDFSASYSLLQRTATRTNVEQWLALDRASSERVMLQIFDAPLDVELRARLEHSIAVGRGLIHPNISRTYRLERSGDHDYIVSQYVRAEREFHPEPASLRSQWLVLEQLLDALSFAHGLGVSHGHINPGCLLIDERNQLHITGFGLPPELDPGHNDKDYLSPQVREGKAPDRSDDMYSLGCLLFTGLTGAARQDRQFESNSPVPAELRRLVTSMLSQSPWERPRELAHARELLKRYILGEGDIPLETIATFTRAPAAGAQSMAGRPVLQRESRVMSAPMAFGGFAFLLVLAGIVFFLLPAERAASPDTTLPVARSDATPAAQTEPKLTPLDIAKQKALEQQGSDVANQLLKLQVGLEDVGVQIWAPDKYHQVQDLSSKADGAYREGDYNGALDLYKQGIAVLTDLRSQVDTVKADNLSKGKAALATGDARAAIEAYTIVNAIDPEDEEVKHDLGRAENLDTVLSLIKDGEFMEGEEKLDDARQKFADANKLDPEWGPAKQALDRIDHKIAVRHFDDAMSVAFTALGNADYDKARDAFHQASKILPGSQEPKDGLEQVEIAVRQHNVEALRADAQSAEAEERWQDAISDYQKILNLDPTLVFATNGMSHAKARLDMEKQFNRYITQPEVMASDTELSNARSLLSDAARVESPGPALKKQMNTLAELIALARIPVPVELKSDNQTDVTVYKVGHLGKIDSTSLKLVPGHYTIVGQRAGYRDVQREVTVLGGRAPGPVYISCSERI